jgi:hypothetical protein
VSAIVVFVRNHDSKAIDFSDAVPRMGGALLLVLLLVLSSSSWPTAALMECSTSLIFWVAVSSHERPHAAIYAISPPLVKPAALVIQRKIKKWWP